MASSELTVIIKDNEKSLKTKHLVYDTYTVSEKDEVIAKLVNMAIKEFNGTPTDITVNIKLVIE